MKCVPLTVYSCAGSLRASRASVRSLWASRILLSALTALGIASAPREHAFGALYTLADVNSSVEFDTTNSTNSFDWQVDGINHLAEQSFWYRIGNVAEQSLNTVSNVSNAVDANFNPGLDTLNVRYTSAGSFRVDVSYSLAGGATGSGSSVLTENVTIVNLSGSALDYHFFQYLDFDLMGSSGGDTAVFTNLNAVQQTQGPAAFGETVATNVPHHRELDFFNATLTKLNDGVATTLSDTPVNTPLGPGDVTWAYQWDFNIPAGGSVNIGIAKTIQAIPEPGSICLAGLAAAGLYVVRRRRAA